MGTRRKLSLALTGLLVVLAGVVVVRALAATPEPVPGAPASPALSFDSAGATERLARAVRIRTISRPPPDPPSDSAAILAFHRFLEASFAEVYRNLESETVSGLSLLFTWEGTDPSLPPVLLSAHMDVVPAGEGADGTWTHPPFAGTVEGGYVWGRGTLDNKGPLMAILEAVDALIRSDFRPRRTVLLAFGHDEEVGGLTGAQSIAGLLERRGIRPVWSLDEGLAVVEGMIPGLSGAAALVGTQEKGYLTLRAVATGAGGHTSRPPDDSAIGSLAQAITRVTEAPAPARLRGATREMLETLSPHLPLHVRLVTENLWLFARPTAWILARDPQLAGLVRTTSAVTVVDAGHVENRIPPSAEALLNFRVAPWETPEEVESRVRALVDDLPIDLLPRAGPRPISPSRWSSAAGVGFDRIRTAIGSVFPDVAVVAPALTPAATDARHYEAVVDDVYRFAPFRADPSTLGRIHGVDERIAVEGYARMIGFYGELLRSATE